MSTTSTFKINVDENSYIDLIIETIPNTSKVICSIKTSIFKCSPAEKFKQETTCSTMMSIDRLEKLIDSLTFIKDKAIEQNGN